MSGRHIFPLSFAQQRLLFLDQLDPGTSAYNLTRVIRMVGPLDSGVLTQTLDRLVTRHASLRTRFAFEAETGYQIVEDGVEFQLPVLDISRLPETDREAEALRLAKGEGHKSFDLASGPLFRSALIRLGSPDHMLVLVMHHIITDGWSMSILFEEIGEIYGELARGTPAKLPELSIQYSDFAQWQRKHFTAEYLQDHVTYWTNKLRGHPDFTGLPTDRPRPAVQSHDGAIEIFQIGEQLARELGQVAERSGATLFMLLLAALQTLIWRCTGSEDVLVGTPIAARNDASFEKIIGFFASTLVMRGNLSGNPTFVELLRRTRETTLEAYDHQDLPFEKLVEAINPRRSLSYPPLFQIMLVLQNAPKQVLKLPGLTLEELEFDGGSSKFDLTLEFWEQDGLRYAIEYCTALFERNSILRLARHVETLLGDIAKNPDRQISQLRILDDATCDSLVSQFNSTDAEYRRDARLEQLFEEQVERAPDRVALVEGSSEITYRELNARANVLAGLLAQKGLNQALPVGVYMERSIDAVVAFLASLKANTPYVPLDISNPRHRLELLIGDAGCRLILTHRGLRGGLPDGVETISLDEPGIVEGDPAPLSTNGTPEDLAYIIYTSGSTGVPKGVAGSHRAAINRFEWMWKTYPFSAGETCCQKTALGFVDSVWEIFGPLLSGNRALIIPDELLLDPDEFVALLARYEIERIVLVPSLLRTMLDVVSDIATRLPKLKLWSTSGELLPSDLVRRFHEAMPAATLLNIYGSSEVTADVTCYQLDRSEDPTPVPIGRPINNTQIFVLDKYKNLVPPLVQGEIHVGGDCLAQGYWKQPELTAQRFIPNLYRSDKSRFLFATGDSGRILADGTIEYLGRSDQQIKLRGFRIEPGEIEANLTAHPLVRDAAIGVHGETSETQHLIAYIVRSEGSGSLTDELRSFLRSRVPEYMVPVVFVELDRLPLLPSGKLDRMALPTPSLDSLVERRIIVDGRTEIEAKLSSIWQEVLERDRVSIYDNFFDLGGHSLSGMRVLARMRRDFHIDIPIRSLFDKPTIAELALELEEHKAKGATMRIAGIVPGAPASAMLDVLRAELRKLSSEEVDALLQSVRAENNSKVGDSGKN
jgi:amino acid adenylation domain-containing protein